MKRNVILAWLATGIGLGLLLYSIIGMIIFFFRI